MSSRLKGKALKNAVRVLHILIGGEGRVHDVATEQASMRWGRWMPWVAYPDPALPTGARRRSGPYAPALIGEDLRATYENCQKMWRG